MEDIFVIHFGKHNRNHSDKPNICLKQNFATKLIMTDDIKRYFNGLIQK